MNLHYIIKLYDCFFYNEKGAASEADEMNRLIFCICSMTGARLNSEILTSSASCWCSVLGPFGQSEALSLVEIIETLCSDWMIL